MRGCPGRCSMHGACLPSGACACFDGWQGRDCAVRCADSAAASHAAGTNGGSHAAAALSEGTVRLSRGNPYAVHAAAGRSLLAQQLEEAPALMAQGGAAQGTQGGGLDLTAQGGGLQGGGLEEQAWQQGIARPLLEELINHPLH